MYKDEIEKLKRAAGFRGPMPDHWWVEVEKVCDFALQHTKERPQLKPITLRVLLDSKIDCEFWDVDSPDTRIISKLTAITPPQARAYYDGKGRPWLHCHPRMNHTHAWLGGECPLPEGVAFKVVLRDGLKSINPEHSPAFRWCHAGNEPTVSPTCDIIAFEVTGLAPGYCWPWE